MELAPLVDSALKVIFCDNDVENGRHPQLFRGLFAPGDLEIAFAVAETHVDHDLDVSLDGVVKNAAQHTLAATDELVEVANAINGLRQSKGIEYLIPDEVLAHLERTVQTSTGHKRKYDELRDRTEREARLRAAARRVNDTFERKERVRRRDGLKELENGLDEKNRDLATTQVSLQREQAKVKRLERSLNCPICRREPWDTATKCGHLFGAECIKQWLKEFSTGMEVDDGVWVLQTPHCPVCRKAVAEEDLRRVYI